MVYNSRFVNGNPKLMELSRKGLADLEYLSVVRKRSVDVSPCSRNINISWRVRILYLHKKLWEDAQRQCHKRQLKETCRSPDS